MNLHKMESNNNYKYYILFHPQNSPITQIPKQQPNAKHPGIYYIEVVIIPEHSGHRIFNG